MKTQHTNDTALRALEILKLLFYTEMTTEELSLALQAKNKADPEFRPDSLYKYFNTFKLFGICPIKNGTKYSILQLPFAKPFSEETKEGLSFLREFAKKIFLALDFDKIERIVKRLSNCAPNGDFSTLTEKTITSYPEFFNTEYEKEEFYKYRDICKAHQKIVFCYNNRALNKVHKITAEPQEVILKPNSCVLRVYNTATAETQEFETSDITELEQLPTRTRPTNVKKSVTFKLKGRLAKSYELKNGERIIDLKPEYIVVINEEEEPQILIRRLLRYGVLCEILYPSALRKELVNLINRIKANYS